jgi:DNA-binding LacI/PurR family transcriptional regulator
MDLLLVTDLAGVRRAAGNSRVHGFVVVDTEDAGERLRLLDELGRPSVLIGGSAAGATCVDLDFEAAGAHGVEHLADLGHRNIGFLGAPSSRAQRTLAGFTAAAMRRGVVGTALSRIDLLPAHPAVTALVLHDEHAVVQVPQDIAVVTVCGAATAKSLASVELSERELGRQAVELLVALAGGAAPPSLTLVPPRLVRHRSLSGLGGGRHDR